MRGVAALAIILGLVAGLTACGGGGEAQPTATGATTTAAAAHATIIPDTAATVVERTETPVATTDSKYDEAWARKQVEPYLKEVYEIVAAQEWNKAYDLESAEARAGCSRSTYVSKMAVVWVLASAFGIDEMRKAQAQDLKEGKLEIAFSEIAPERITYTVGDDEPTTIVREKGKWLTTDPLGQDCASLDMDAEEAETPTATTVVETPAPAIEQATVTPPPAYQPSFTFPYFYTEPDTFRGTVTEIRIVDEIPGKSPYSALTPPAGAQFVLVMMSVTNTGNEASSVEWHSFRLHDDQGRLFTMDFPVPDHVLAAVTAEFYFDRSGCADTIQPGLTLDELFVFLTPTGTTGLVAERCPTDGC